MTDTRRHTTDWTGAIARNRAALLRVVAVLFVMAGLDEGGADTVPRRVWRRILRLLRPAESAARRLIVIAARGIEVAPPKPRPEKAPSAWEDLQAKGLLIVHEGMNLGLARMWRPEPETPEKPASVLPAFPLTDPPRLFDTRGWDGLRPFPKDGFHLADENEEVNATPICRRIQALKRALDDIDGQAKRLARREARRELALKSIQGGFAPASPSGQRLAAYDEESQRLAAYDKESAKLKGANHRRVLRLGRPPGHQVRPTRDIDDILRECHSLALRARKLEPG